MLNVDGSVEMLLLSCTGCHLFGDFPSLCLCDSIRLVWQDSHKTGGGLGNLGSRRGQHLVVLAACGYFEITGKEPAFLFPVVLAVLQETKFLLVVRRQLSSSCWTQEVVFCFSPQTCCVSSFSLGSTSAEGIE